MIQMLEYAKPGKNPDENSKETFQRKAAEVNRTGIPSPMKERFESLSGFSLSDVQVHYNSDKPAQLQALAYTQGNHIHISPGQDKYLQHELGHIVQQKEGKVRATTSIIGMPVNDDKHLEQEVDKIAAGNMPRNSPAVMARTHRHS